MALAVQRIPPPSTHEPVWVVAASAVAAPNTVAAPIRPIAVTTARPLRSELMGSRVGMTDLLRDLRVGQGAGRCRNEADATLPYRYLSGIASAQILNISPVIRLTRAHVVTPP